MSAAVLMYHNLGRGVRYALRPEAFADQMRYLHENGFKTILPGELGKEAKGGGRSVMVTFDDGYLTDYTLALPLMARYGFKGVSFITTGFMGRPGYLDWSQVRALKKAGFSIQSHTHTHPLLSLLREEEIRRELRLSRRCIEERLGTEVTSLALPGGRYEGRVAPIARGENYRFVFGSRPGIDRFDGALPEVLSRMIVTGDTSLSLFARLVALDPSAYRAAALTYVVKRAVQRCIGTQRYYRFWRRFLK
ncbi:MAG: polysaccharide deacetylase family protein [Endomicrobiales bacterium]